MNHFLLLSQLAIVWWLCFGGGAFANEVGRAGGANAPNAGILEAATTVTVLLLLPAISATVRNRRPTRICVSGCGGARRHVPNS